MCMKILFALMPKEKDNTYLVSRNFLETTAHLSLHSFLIYKGLAPFHVPIITNQFRVRQCHKSNAKIRSNYRVELTKVTCSKPGSFAHFLSDIPINFRIEAVRLHTYIRPNISPSPQRFHVPHNVYNVK